MNDPVEPSRQAPRWGEYASAEELEALRPAVAPEPRPTAPPTSATAPVVTRRWDLPGTVALLVLGAWNVLGSIPSYLDFGELIRQAAALAGFADVTVAASARAAGVSAIVVNVVLLLVAIAGSVWLLRRGRLAFWLPIAAGALSVLTVSVIGVVVLDASGLGGLGQDQG